MSLSIFLQKYQGVLENCLADLVPSPPCPYQQLYDAAQYSLLDGGKRIRPLLTLIAVHDLGGSVEEALHPACALECIHTYSLIHDDLPCMDDDDFRRNKPSLHRAFSEGMAVLTGDYLLTRAFQILANAPHLSSEKKVLLIQSLSRGSGGEGMIGGQVLDIQAEGQDLELQELQNVHQMKTGALLSTALDFAAILMGSCSEVRQLLWTFGQQFGLAFQIMDDILDLTESESHGKKRCSDVFNHKSTYPDLLGLEGARERAEELIEEMRITIQQVPGEATLLKEFCLGILEKVNISCS